MRYTVPVHFTVAAKSVKEAEHKIRDRLALIQPRYPFVVQEAQSQDGITDANISLELRNFLYAEVQNNDQDVSGYNTDLNYCMSSLQQMPDDVIIEQCGSIMLPEIEKELQALIDKYGGGTAAASFDALQEK